MVTRPHYDDMMVTRPPRHSGEEDQQHVVLDPREQQNFYSQQINLDEFYRRSRDSRRVENKDNKLSKRTGELVMRAADDRDKQTNFHNNLHAGQTSSSGTKTGTGRGRNKNNQRASKGAC